MSICFGSLFPSIMAFPKSKMCDDWTFFRPLETKIWANFGDHSLLVGNSPHGCLGKGNNVKSGILGAKIFNRNVSGRRLTMWINTACRNAACHVIYQFDGQGRNGRDGNRLHGCGSETWTFSFPTKAIVGTMEYLQRLVETELWALWKWVISRPLGFLVSTFLTGNWYNQEHRYWSRSNRGFFRNFYWSWFCGISDAQRAIRLCLWSTGQTNAVHRGWNLTWTATNWWIGFTYRRHPNRGNQIFLGRTWNGMHM